VNLSKEHKEQFDNLDFDHTEAMDQAAAQNSFSGILDLTKASKSMEEILAAASGPASDVLNALTDIPAQLENMARVNLAKSFIFRGDDGSYCFDDAAFEKLWAYLSPSDDDGDAEQIS